MGRATYLWWSRAVPSRGNNPLAIVSGLNNTGGVDFFGTFFFEEESMNTFKKMLLGFSPGRVICRTALLPAMIVCALVLTTSRDWWPISIAIGLFIGIVSWGLLILLGLALFTKLIESETMLVGEDLAINHVFERGPALWKWDPRLRDGRHVSFASFTEHFVMKLDPVTPNPKVRHLTYLVKLSGRGTPQSAQEFYREFGTGHPTWRRFVQSLLYDFNEAHSKELAELFNPHEEEQQRRFKSLIRGFLDPKLEGRGLFLMESGFDDALNPAQR
jgi:hypothetical protein